MPRFAHLFWMALLSCAAGFGLACGNSALSGALGGHQIVALAIVPSVADAKDYPSGEIPFVAVGTYRTPPVTLSHLQAHWAVTGQGGQLTKDVSVTSNGIAQCTPTASGTYTVGAWVLQYAVPPPVTCDVVTAFGNPCGDSLLALAQLTCP